MNQARIQELAAQIRAAVAADHTTLHYGQVSVEDARRALVVALWRYHHPQRGQGTAKAARRGTRYAA